MQNDVFYQGNLIVSLADKLPIVTIPHFHVKLAIERRFYCK